MTGDRPSDNNIIDALKRLQPHEHLCLIYESEEEWKTTIVPFIRLGLEQGEKCIYIVDEHTADQLITYLEKDGADAKQAIDRGQLTILADVEAYIRDGEFDPDRMIALIRAETNKAIAEGYSALRVTGEMTRVLKGAIGSERLIEYEAKLNRDLFPDSPCLAICQYNRHRFDPEIIKSVIMTHPHIVSGGRVYENIYYIPPEDFLSGEKAEVEVDRILNNVRNYSHTEKKLRDALAELSVIHDNAPMAMMLVDCDRKVRKVNGDAARFAKRDPKDMFGMVGGEALRCLNSLDNPKGCGFGPKCSECGIRNAVLDTFADCQSRRDVEAWLPFPGEDGREEKCLQVSTAYLRIGEEERVLICVQDITDRKKAELGLRDSEAFTRAVMDHLPIGIAVNSVDPDVNFNYMNDNFVRIYRTTEEALSEADSFWEGVYHDPDFRTRLRKRVLDDCASGDPSRMHWEDVPIARSGEETTYINARNIPVPGKKLMISTVWDVTDHKRSEIEIGDLNSFLLSIRNLNQAIMRESDFNTLLDESSQILTEVRGYMDVSIFYTDEKGRIEPVTHHGGHGHDTWVFDPSVDKDVPECVRVVLGTREPLIIDSKDERCISCQYCSHDRMHQTILVPMPDKDGKVRGMIHACLEPDRVLHKEEIALFEQVAGDLVSAHDKIMTDNFLAENEKRLKDAETLGHMGNWFWNRVSNILVWSDEIYNIFGVDRNVFSLSSDSIISMLHPDDRAWNEKNLKAIMQEGDSKEHEFRIVRPDGEVRYIHQMMKVERDASGEALSLFGIIMDVTGSRLAEKAVRESEEKYRTLIQTTSEGYWMLDESGITVDVNDALCSMLGYTRAELIGHSPLDFMDLSNRKIFETRSRFAIDLDQRTYTLRLIGKEDSLDVNISATTIRDPNGSPKGTFAMITDISELKRINDELMREKRKSETLLDLISHDIGNIHQGILSSLELLSIDHLTIEMRDRNLKNIRNLANRSVHLVKNVIVLTRLESMDMDLREIDVLEAMDKSIESCRSAFPDRTIQYNSASKYSQVLIKAEPILGEVFFNLFHNGVKVQKEREPRIEAEVIPDPENACVRIRISDWGPGIPDESKEKLLYRTRTPGEKVHSGIGLSLVRELVNRYNGSVRIRDRVEGDPGSGACFELTFPYPMIP